MKTASKTKKGALISKQTPPSIRAGVFLAGLGILILYFARRGVSDAQYGVTLTAITLFWFLFNNYIRDTASVLPRPLLRVGVLVVAVLYLMLMVFLLFTPLNVARNFFRLFDFSHVWPPAEQTYVEHCDLSSPKGFIHSLRLLFDEFSVYHVLGYWTKMLIIRDVWLVHSISLGFEVIEFTFQYWLHNFKECWWDHLLLDVLGCNALGITLGRYTLRRLNACKYSWVKHEQEKALVEKKNSVTSNKKVSHSWRIPKWKFFNSPYYTIDAVLILSAILLQETNCFFSKHILWMPNNHPFVVGRVFMWSCMGLVAVHNFHCYRQGNLLRVNVDKKSIAHLWVCILDLVLESVVIIRFVRQGEYFLDTPLPFHVPFLWSLSALSWILWFIVRYWRYRDSHRHSKTRVCVAWVLFALPVFFLGLLCAIGATDLHPLFYTIKTYTERLIKPFLDLVAIPKTLRIIYSPL